MIYDGITDSDMVVYAQTLHSIKYPTMFYLQFNNEKVCSELAFAHFGAIVYSL